MVLSSTHPKYTLFLLTITLSAFLSCCNAYNCGSGYQELDHPTVNKFPAWTCFHLRKDVFLRVNVGVLRCNQENQPQLYPSGPESIGLGVCYRLDSVGFPEYKTVLTGECIAPCELCDLQDSRKCTTCIATSPLFYQNKCYSICPAGSFQADPKTCLSCHASCETCTGAGDTRCSSCNQGYYSSGPSSCLACASPCATCAGSSTTCSTCIPGVPFQYEGVCHQACPSGSYQASPTTCEACDPKCAKCSDNASKCTSCHPCEPFLYNDDCHENCPAGTYENSDNTCATCSSECETCSGDASTCTTCPSSTPLLYDGGCHESCPPGSYQNSENTCEACSSSCETCSGNAEACITCPPSLPILFNNHCYSSCPSGYYAPDTPNNCEKCPSYCAGPCKPSQGSEEPLCNKCSIVGAVYYQGKCYLKCPAGSYQASPEACAPCSEFCATCTGDETCLTCLGSAYLHDGVCLQSCPSGYYGSSGTCERCSVHCKTCSGSATTCTSCSGPTPYLYDNTCVSGCPHGTYPHNNVCENL